MHISHIFHKVVQRRIYNVAGYTVITLSQIVHREFQWKNFENRSINGKNMNKREVAHFLLAHPVLWDSPTVYNALQALPVQ